MELMIAIGIFSALGLLLVPMLNQGITQWRRGEERRELFERGHLILQMLADDLASTYSEAGPRPGNETHPVQVKLLGDADTWGRPRLRFVRTIKGAGTEPGSATAGDGTPAAGYTEYRTRIGDMNKKIRPLRGLTEVAYLLGHSGEQRNTLFRAERSPIGGPDSLFQNALWADQAAVEARALPVAENVLMLRFLYWGQFTASWDEDKLPGTSMGDEGGPHAFWDSTRGLLPEAPRRRSRMPITGAFDLAVGDASANDPVDDIFPSMVQIQVVLGSFGTGAPIGTLIGDIGEKDNKCTADHQNFPTTPGLGFDIMVLKIDDEWIEYNQITGSGFKLGKRGLFGTKPARHADGAAIRTGALFTRSVALPAHRNYWNR